MSSVILLFVSAIGYLIAYHTYGKFLSHKIFSICAKNITPAQTMRDDIDFVPSKKQVVFGHHYASIAGTGPIVGPAIGIIWGWVPAIIWILFGSIFMGAVHDLGSLVISLRNRGESIGEISRRLINPRVRLLFLLVIFFSLWIVVAIFCLVMAVLFNMFPESVIPIWTQIPIAIALGNYLHRNSKHTVIMTVAAVVLMYITIIIGSYIPVTMPTVFGISPLTSWTIILLIYTYIASVIPVWKLLQPRDFINAYQLLVALGLLFFGIVAAQAPIVAPAFNFHPQGAPPLLPFLFVTIACGAISGFHCMVSSGTTSKQLSTEPDAIFVGFGSMLIEGFMAIMVVIAVSAGIGMMVKNTDGTTLTGVQAWSHFYSSWGAMEGLSAKVGAFVKGAANLLNAIGIPHSIGITLMGVFVASFAGTTLDTSTRIQRYVINEVAHTTNLNFLKGRHGATLIAVLFAALLALSQGGGKGGLILWPLFGTSNQLLAGLSLLATTVYLLKKKKPALYTFIPMVFIILFTGWAMIHNLSTFFQDGKWHLFFIGGAILVLELWMIAETAIMHFTTRKNDGFYAKSQQF
ncbi:carbon starvation protein A [bacterium]|nr:carbon starvation protein A [bacterium]MCP5462859.1 carbon starvation protein A [bacterium]